MIDPEKLGRENLEPPEEIIEKKEHELGISLEVTYYGNFQNKEEAKDFVKEKIKKINEENEYLVELKEIEVDRI